MSYRQQRYRAASLPPFIRLGGAGPVTRAALTLEKLLEGEISFPQSLLISQGVKCVCLGMPLLPCGVLAA